jgi:hypothetical protein
LFYQDRLGTNIGKTQKKCRFPSGYSELTKLLLLHGADHTLTTWQSGFLWWYLGWWSSWVMRTTFNAAEMAVVGA